MKFNFRRTNYIAIVLVISMLIAAAPLGVFADRVEIDNVETAGDTIAVVEPAGDEAADAAPVGDIVGDAAPVGDITNDAVPEGGSAFVSVADGVVATDSDGDNGEEGNGHATPAPSGHPLRSEGGDADSAASGSPLGAEGGDGGVSGSGKCVKVSYQYTEPTAGIACNVLYAVSTTEIEDGVYDVGLREAPVGVSACAIKINEDLGILSISTTPDTPQGMHEIKAVIDETLSESFNLNILYVPPTIEVSASGFEGLQVRKPVSASIGYILENGEYAAENDLILKDFKIGGLPEGLHQEILRMSDDAVRVLITGEPTAANSSSTQLIIPSFIPAPNIIGTTENTIILNGGSISVGPIAKGDGAAVNGAPTVSATTPPSTNSITVNDVYNVDATTAQPVQYAISTISGLSRGELNALATWQQGVTFTGSFITGTPYYIYARTAENSNFNAGAARQSAAIIIGGGGGTSIPVVNISGAASVAYAGTTINLSSLGSLFTVDPNAGARTYTIESGGTGSGTISSANQGILTVSRAGTINIGLVTAANGNYEAGAKVIAVLTVSPAVLTISGITAIDREYDGTSAVTLAGGTLYGIYGGDNVIASVPTTGNMYDNSAGNGKTVTIGAIGLTGADAGKYTLTQPPAGTVVVNITRKSITGAAGITVTKGSQSESGTIGIGDTLTADLSGVTPGATLVYQWLRNGSVISGATGSSYVIGNTGVDPKGSVMTVRVTGTGNYTGEITSSSVMIDQLVLSGNIYIETDGLYIGGILTLDLSAIEPGTASYNIRWLRDGSVISGANGTKYTIVSSDLGKQVTAEVTGTGSYSGTLSESVDIPDTATDAPRNFYASVGNGQVILSWTIPSGVSSVTRYEVIRTGQSNWTNVNLSTSYTYTGLSNGTSYTFRVRALVSGKYSSEASVSATPQASSTVGAPTSFTASAGDKQVTLSWNTPSSNETILRYEVTRSGTTTWTRVDLNTNYTYTGLTNGTNYTFRVRAVTASGNGSEASVSATPQVSAATAPSAPRYLTANPGAGEIRLTWSAPTSTGGGDITHYEVQKDNDAWIIVSGTIYTYSGLVAGTSYTFRVRAVNSAGTGAQVSVTGIPLASAAGNDASNTTGGGATGDGSTGSGGGEVDSPEARAFFGDFELPAGSTSGVITSYNTEIDSDGMMIINDGTFSLSSGAFFTVPYGTTISPEGLVNCPDTGGEFTVTQANGLTFTISSDAIIVLNEASKLGYVASFNNQFVDVSTTDWFFNDVGFVIAHSLMIGTNTNPMEFSPETSTTRGMIVTMLYRMHGSPDVSGLNNRFPDVGADQWYYDAVKWAEANGIVYGDDNGRFNPEVAISRQDMAVILMRYVDFTGFALDASREYPSFNDRGAIADYATAAVEKACKSGIINGKPNNLLDPLGFVTRAEVSAMLHRLFE